MRPAAYDIVAWNRLAAGALACRFDCAWCDESVVCVESLAREDELGIEFISSEKPSLETGQNPAMTRYVLWPIAW